MPIIEKVKMPYQYQDTSQYSNMMPYIEKVSIQDIQYFSFYSFHYAIQG